MLCVREDELARMRRRIEPTLREDDMEGNAMRVPLAVLLTVSVAVASLVSGPTSAFAGPREQAKRIHDRLVGVPPAPDIQDAMEGQILVADALSAA